MHACMLPPSTSRYYSRPKFARLWPLCAMAFRFTPKILFIYYIFKNFIFIFIFFMKTPFPSKSWYSSSYSLRNIISLWIFALHLLPPDIPYSKKQDSPTHKLANLSLSLLGLRPHATTTPTAPTPFFLIHLSFPSSHGIPCYPLQTMDCTLQRLVRIVVNINGSEPSASHPVAIQLLT